MSGDPEDPALIALGAAVSDGAPINWDDIERRAASADEKRLVRELRQIAAVVIAHRSTEETTDPTPAAVAEAEPVRNWRHLVLFEPIGQGAFGTVYRGWDSQLDREVAVKLISKASAGATSPLAEARNLARVRHSNVVVVHGADQDDQQVGIWMEYIDGQTLASMIRAGGPMSARETIGIGIDLCRALSALHAAGLVHRDIKAHNVMREVGGRTVLMDFSGAQPLARNSHSNVFSGTPLYMAPELFDGGTATIATDVYALGVLLFFLLSARVPVEGVTVSELRGAHARGSRKQLRGLRPDVSNAVIQVVERATSPEATSRYQSAGELETALTTAAGADAVLIGALEKGQQSGGGFASRVVRRPGMWLTTALLVGVIAAVAFARWGPPAPASPVVRFTVGPPYTTGSWPRLSPDGRLLVFGVLAEGQNRLWIRALDSLEGHPLMNTTADETPFWSPDSRTLAFFEEDKLKKISVTGGEAEIVADARRPQGGDWSPSGTILFASENGIQRVAPDGTGLSRVTVLDESLGEYRHGWPEFLPDGRRFLYVIRSSQPERSGIYMTSLDGGAPRRVMPAYSRVAYAAGHLLFVRDGRLMAQPFDDATATVHGRPVAISARVKYHASSDAAFDVAESGVLLYGLTAGQMSTRLVLLDRRGREVRALTADGAHRQPRFSPDGERVAAERLNRDDSNADIWVYGVKHPSEARLTNNDAPDVKPVWSPDGKRIAYSSKRGALFQVFTKQVDSTEPEQPLLTTAGDKYVEHWSADGRYLSGTVGGSGLWVLPVASGGAPQQLRENPRAATWQSEFSPDGRWIAYMSEESGNPEVYVEPFPGTGSRWQISARGGAEPHWRADGRELTYLGADGFIMSAMVPDAGWQYVRPRPLFRYDVPDLTGNGDFGVSPDGELFVVNCFIADPLVPPIEVVVNWTSLLQR